MNLYKYIKNSKSLKHFKNRRSIPVILGKEFAKSVDWYYGSKRSENVPFPQFLIDQYITPSYDILAKDPHSAFLLAKYYHKKPVPELEDAIAQHGLWSYLYAIQVKKERFKKGEPKISNYTVKDVYNNRFGTNL